MFNTPWWASPELTLVGMRSVDTWKKKKKGSVVNTEPLASSSFAGRRLVFVSRDTDCHLLSLFVGGRLALFANIMWRVTYQCARAFRQPSDGANWRRQASREKVVRLKPPDRQLRFWLLHDHHCKRRNAGRSPEYKDKVMMLLFST